MLRQPLATASARTCAGVSRGPAPPGSRSRRTCTAPPTSGPRRTRSPPPPDGTGSSVSNTSLASVAGSGSWTSSTSTTASTVPAWSVRARRSGPEASTSAGTARATGRVQTVPSASRPARPRLCGQPRPGTPSGANAPTARHSRSARARPSRATAGSRAAWAGQGLGPVGGDQPFGQAARRAGGGCGQRFAPSGQSLPSRLGARCPAGECLVAGARVRRPRGGHAPAPASAGIDRRSSRASTGRRHLGRLRRGVEDQLEPAVARRDRRPR